MTLKNYIFILLFAGALALFTYNVIRLIKYLKLAKPENRFDNIPERIKNTLKIALAQTKILRDPVAGPVHVIIFWGFILFLFAVVEALIQGFYSPFTLEFLGPLFSVVTVIQDFFGALVIFSVLMALYRRFITRVPRLQVDKSGSWDAAAILLMILFVVVSMFGQNISLVAKNNFVLSEYEVRPISAALSRMFYTDTANAEVYYDIFWFSHIIFVLGFLNYLPYSKHLHVLTSVPNVFFAKTKDKRYQIKPLNLEDETIENYGAADFEHLTWKQVFDGYTCTECGRCTAACPAANTGKPLSPRKIIVDIRRRAMEKAPKMLAGEELEPNITLVHDYITDDELWACTSCNACVYECPVSIEHLDSIIDMRRDLVLTESAFPAELNNVFRNLETNYTPWAFNSQDRANWAEGLDIKTMSEDPNCEYLFWVGCAGSFDQRYQKVSKAFAKLMQKGGVDFRILGVEEKCNGDAARRIGNEYLAQMLMKENVEVLNNYGVKKIVTACPHCYNIFKNEYKQFGGEYEVKHHSELISEMIDSGKIQLKDESSGKQRITYHDSCYLGRYNDIYDEPRSPLEKISGVDLVEMNRVKDKGFCCGAGGGRMFMEEVHGERINIERTREALETKPDVIASACPFCMTMLNDGVKAFDKTEETQVKDIAEITLENCK
jgi:Fe-S oxidoreductase